MIPMGGHTNGHWQTLILNLETGITICHTENNSGALRENIHFLLALKDHNSFQQISLFWSSDKGGSVS